MGIQNADPTPRAMNEGPTGRRRHEEWYLELRERIRRQMLSAEGPRLHACEGLARNPRRRRHVASRVVEAHMAAAAAQAGLTYEQWLQMTINDHRDRARADTRRRRQQVAADDGHLDEDGLDFDMRHLAM
jgi:hypothetical protein